MISLSRYRSVNVLQYTVLSMSLTRKQYLLLVKFAHFRQHNHFDQQMADSDICSVLCGEKF